MANTFIKCQMQIFNVNVKWQKLNHLKLYTGAPLTVEINTLIRELGPLNAHDNVIKSHQI